MVLGREAVRFGISEQCISLSVFDCLLAALNSARAMFFVFGDPDNRDFDTVFIKHFLCGIHLRLGAIYHYEARQWPFVVAEPARKYLTQSSRIIPRFAGADSKFAIIVFLANTIFDND